MNAEYFERFHQSLQHGLRRQAAAEIRAFVDSFSTVEEKRDWSEGYLEHWNGGHLRHELYEGVIFPALLEGFRRSDPWCLRWLARTSQNLCGATHLWRQVGMKSQAEFLETLLVMCPDDEQTRHELLSCYVARLRYAEHEWPAGILDGSNGASLDGCKSIRKELEMARKLDRENLHTDFFSDFGRKLEEYRIRLVPSAE